MCERWRTGGSASIRATSRSETEPATPPASTFIRDLYSERYVDLTADAVVCRHTLEHIAPVGEFLRMVRRGIGDRNDTWCSSSCPTSCGCCARSRSGTCTTSTARTSVSARWPGSSGPAGFDVLNLSLDFDDQYILIEARPQSGAPAPALILEDDMAQLDRGRRSFRSRVHEHGVEMARRRSVGSPTAADEP